MTLSDLQTWLNKNGFTQPEIPDWYRAWQSKYSASLLANGLPTRKHERWKYADFNFLNALKYSQSSDANNFDLTEIVPHYRLSKSESILLVFVNGVFMPIYSDLHKLPADVIVSSLQEAYLKHPELLQKQLMDIDAIKYPFASLNISVASDGLFFYIPDQCELSLPIHIVMIPMGDSFVAHPKLFFSMGKKSQLTIFDEYSSIKENAYCMNVVSFLQVGAGAKLNYYKLQQEGKFATHIAHTFIQQDAESEVIINQIATGSTFARDEIAVNLNAKGAQCRAAGFYQLHQANQYIDFHIDIQHQAPNSQSEMLYKGIIDNHSRAVFNGRLYVGKNAQKITAHQTNHHLLLSQTAESYSKPELEIYADDVKCKHGATTGELDQEALFYLTARGIPQEEAKQILLQAFAYDVIERFTQHAIKNYVKGVLGYENSSF